jgi:hypothetical protein
MKKKLVALLIVVIIGGVIAGGIYYYQTKKQVKVPTVTQKENQIQNPAQDINKNQEASPDLNEIKSNSVDVSDLKTYRNEDMGFEFQYPPQYTFVPKTKDWDEEKKQNKRLNDYKGSYFAGELSINNRAVSYLMFLSKDYYESMGRGGGFSDYNSYIFNEEENKYYLGHWWNDKLEEVKGSVKNVVIGGKEGIIIDYNEFLKNRDCVAGYPFPYLASLIKTGWTKYPILNISFSDVLSDPEKCIFIKPLPDDVALKIIESFKFTK